MKIGLPPLRLTIDLEGLLGFGFEDTNLESRMISAMAQSTLLAGEFARGVWLQVAGAMDIRGGFGSAGVSYIQGIETAEPAIERVEIGDANIALTVAVVNTSPHAPWVEEGHSAFSLVDKIDWGSTSGRIKRGKNGPYLHVPFRHAAYVGESQMVRAGYTTAARKAMMPADVSRAARALTATVRRNAGAQYRPGRQITNQLQAPPQFLQADRYTWGDRLQRDVRAGVTVSPPGRAGSPGVATIERRSERQVGRGLVNPAWQGSKYQGLFRAQQGSGSHYMTIRTITPQSLGWKIPAMMGRFVANRVATMLRSGATADALEKIIRDPFFAALGIVPDGG